MTTPARSIPLRSALFALAAVGVVSGSALSAQGAGSVWREVEIEPGVIALVTADDLNPSSYANAIVFYGSEATLVVDTQDRPSAARRITDAIRSRGLPPVRWVVNTHFHGDHVLGNAALAREWPDAEFLAHPVTIDSLKAGGVEAIRREADRLTASADRIRAALDAGQIPEGQVPAYRRALVDRRSVAAELDQVRPFVPRTAVPASKVIELGGRDVVVLHPGPAHTRGDLVVWDPERRFLAAGDLLEEAPLWIEGADVRGWAAALDRLAKLQPERVLPSHGRVRADAELLEAHRRILTRVIRVAEVVEVESETAILSEFDDLRGLLEPWGVEATALDEWFVSAVRSVSDRPRTAPPPRATTR